jgi:hypothetical protein
VLLMLAWRWLRLRTTGTLQPLVLLLLHCTEW